MKFEFGKYQSQVLISLKFLSKNKDNELSAEKSKSYKYLMDKSTAKELVMDIEFHNCFEKKDPIFVIENAGGYNYRNNEVAIESIEFFTEDKYFRTKCSNPTSLVYLTKAKIVAGNSPIKCKITVDGLDEHELEIIERFSEEQKKNSIYIHDSKGTLEISNSGISYLDNSNKIAYGTTTSSIFEPIQHTTSTCKDCAEAMKKLTLALERSGIGVTYENTNNNNNNIERGNNMFNNVMKDFYCGPATDVKMSIYGPAFRAVSGGGEEIRDTYVAYHDGDYIDVCDGILDIDNCAYVMPIAAKSVKKGDFVRNCGTWLRVTSITNETIEGENVYTRNIVKVRPTKNMFGFNFYSKLMTFDIMGSTSEDNPFGNLLPLILLGNKDSKMNDMLPLIFMNKDFDMSNPMMMYLLANKNDANSNLMTIMMMSQFMNKEKKEEKKEEKNN